MRLVFFLFLSFLSVSSCSNNSNDESENLPELSKSQTDQKLIEVCERMDGILDADIKDDKLTLKANISKEEAQKLSDGMLSEIKSYSNDIKTVIVCDIDYNMIAYSGK